MNGNGERVKCLLCGVLMPAEDIQTQWGHMCLRHEACSIEEAKSMTAANFVRIEERSGVK